jgi:hypothetical protein
MISPEAGFFCTMTIRRVKPHALDNHMGYMVRTPRMGICSA